ncbi:MAG: hypothetical protein AB1689_09185 [Thermodesulfobacteriota bacterium]
MDHAFASPGDTVAITLDEGCSAEGSCLSTPADANVVTVVFKPTPGGAANVALLAADCAALAERLDACRATRGVAAAGCVQAAAGALDVPDPRRVRFVFPDTDAFIGTAEDDLTWAGPAAIAVTSSADPLPCELAVAGCDRVAGTLACVDALFAGDDPAAGPTPDETFRHFTALPPPNDFQAVCSAPSPPCTGRVDELRFALDVDGNVLLPMDWRGVLVNSSGIPVARLLRGASPLHAFEGGGGPIRIPGRAFVGSYAPEGGKLPPIFDPLAASADPADPSLPLDDVTLFGSADAPRSVLRLARRAAGFRECVGGPNDRLPCFADVDCETPGGGGPDGQCAASTCRSPSGEDLGVPCTADADCASGGECGPALFDFRSRVVESPGGPSSGTVVLRLRRCIGGTRPLQTCSRDTQCGGGQCGSFALAALDPVPLDGLNQSDELSAFVVDERIEDRDLNGDNDRDDEIVVLADRRTGEVRTIGAEARRGRAVVRVRVPPFSFPAVGVEGELLAFLESEVQQRARDSSRDGDVADAVLRVFRADGREITPHAAADPEATVVVDPAPRIDGRSLVWSEGLLVYRRSEAGAARRTTERIGAPTSGLPALSGDGSLVAFKSTASTLVPGDTNAGDDVFLFDRTGGTTRRISLSSDGTEGFPCAFNGCNFFLGMSAAGDRVVFSSFAPNLVPDDGNQGDDVFLRDLTSPSSPRTVRISVGPDGLDPDGQSFTPSISAGGRFVVFSSVASNLLPEDAPVADANFLCGFDDAQNCEDVFFQDADRVDPVNELVSVSTTGEQGDDASFVSAASVVSADGRFVAFSSLAGNLAPGADVNPGEDVFVRDRCVANGIAVADCTPTTRLVNVDSTGRPANVGSLDDNPRSGGSSARPTISSDGRSVAFESSSTNLVAGDTNDAADVFVHDLATGITERVSVGSSGVQGNGASRSAALSADGRYVAFESVASNLVERDTNSESDVFVHDRLTGTTERVSVTADGRQASRESGRGLFLAISADGRFVAFPSKAPNLVPGKRNDGRDDVFVRGVADDQSAVDLFRDGKPDDVVLEVLDARGDVPSATTLCPADEVAVAAGRVAYLRPEAPVDPLATPSCPKGPLNGNTDTDDRVVQLWDGTGTSSNLARAADTIALSDTYLAALVSETAPAVVEVFHPLPSGEWRSTGQAADEIAALGRVVAFLTPEQAQQAILDQDGDRADRVLQVYDPTRAPPVRNVARPAEDFVIGPAGLIAFRTREAALCDAGAGVVGRDTCSGGSLPAGCARAACDANGDGDCCDDVLQVYDFAADRVIESRSTIRPCAFEACDPRIPYKVQDDTVTFLTFERDEGCSTGPRCIAGATDLNGDLDSDDLVLQVFNARLASEVAARAGSEALAAALAAEQDGVDDEEAPMRRTLAAVSAGLCTSTGAACATDEECHGGPASAAVCFIPPGGCIADLGVACEFDQAGRSSSCGANAFCEPVAGMPGDGRCKRVEGSCASNAECSTGAVCNSAGQTLQRLLAPLSRPGSGGEVFTSAGRCLDDAAGACCSDDTDCARGESCDLIDRIAACGGRGACRGDRGICGPAGRECPADSSCRGQIVVATASDQDHDEIPDAFDNCPTTPNPAQQDGDRDTVGDACERQVCGNGVVEPGETCDDGNQSGGDACPADCGAALCPSGAQLLGAALTVSGLGEPIGDESIRVTGRIDCAPPASCAAFDPLATGAQLRIEAVGSGLAALVDLSEATAPIPPGAVGSGCDPARDGWSRSSNGRRFTYANRSGALPGAACAAGSAQGLETLKLTDRRSSRGDVDVRAVVTGTAVPREAGALRVTIVIGGLDGASPDACATRLFDDADCREGPAGRTRTCR